MMSEQLDDSRAEAFLSQSIPAGTARESSKLMCLDFETLDGSVS